MMFFPFLFLWLAIMDGAEVVAFLMAAFQFGGLALGIVGLILGIVGAAKDDRKAPGIVGIVFGSIDIGIALLTLGLLLVLA